MLALKWYLPALTLVTVAVLLIAGDPLVYENSKNVPTTTSPVVSSFAVLLFFMQEIKEVTISNTKSTDLIDIHIFYKVRVLYSQMQSIFFIFYKSIKR